MIVCERIEWIDGHEDEFAKCELIKPVGCDAIEPFGYADLDFAPCSMIALAGFRQLNAVERRNIGTTDCSETKLIACNGPALTEPNAFELLARRNGGFVKCDKLKPVEYGAIESIRSDIEFVKSGGIALAATLGFELINVALGCHQLGAAEPVSPGMSCPAICLGTVTRDLHRVSERHGFLFRRANGSI